MIITHLKQAWQLLRQNKLFSGIYIAGTALAIASTTIFAVIYYVKLAPVYPEYMRDRIVTLSTLEYDTPYGYKMQTAAFSYDFLNDFLYHLENAEAVSGYIGNYQLKMLKLPAAKDHIDVVMHMSDPSFFRILNYDFIAGAPFSQSDFESGLHRVAVSDRVARHLFGDPVRAVGETVSLDFDEYEICGVFREGSAINSMSFTQAVVPYTVLPNYMVTSSHAPLSGAYKAMILTDNLAALNAEFAEYARKYKTSHDGQEINFLDQPMTSTTRALNPNGNDDFDIMTALRFNLLILLTLLVVPALNLSGMIASRMDARRSELSIRKSFGATQGRLLSQVLWENLILTIVGGLFGLVLTWIVLSTDATLTLSNIGTNHSIAINRALTVRLTPDMMFAPAMFGFSFAVCVALNLMSAIIPAWIALRRPIVKSLK